jgi:hypothetical protein
MQLALCSPHTVPGLLLSKMFPLYAGHLTMPDRIPNNLTYLVLVMVSDMLTTLQSKNVLVRVPNTV